MYIFHIIFINNRESSPSSIRAPETDMSRPRIEPRSPQWEASTLAKSYSNNFHCLLFGTSTTMAVAGAVVMTMAGATAMEVAVGEMETL